MNTISEKSMPIDKRILFVRLSNRLSWWFLNKDYPDVEFDENTTIGELQTKLDNLYHEITEKEKEKAEKPLVLKPNSRSGENDINTQTCEENATVGQNEAENKEMEDIFDLCSI